MESIEAYLAILQTRGADYLDCLHPKWVDTAALDEEMHMTLSYFNCEIDGIFPEGDRI